MHFLEENERDTIYITANSLKSAAPTRLRRSLVVVTRRSTHSPTYRSVQHLRRNIIEQSQLQFRKFDIV